MPGQSTPKPRHAEPLVLSALSDTRIVALVGPRQSGKTTLARKIAAKEKMSFITLDDEQFRQFANDDPGEFIRGLDRAVIDEVQRAPGLILALKKAVDEDASGPVSDYRIGRPVPGNPITGLACGPRGHN